MVSLLKSTTSFLVIFQQTHQLKLLDNQLSEEKTAL